MKTHIWGVFWFLFDRRLRRKSEWHRLPCLLEPLCILRVFFRNGVGILQVESVDLLFSKGWEFESSSIFLSSLCDRFAGGCYSEIIWWFVACKEQSSCTVYVLTQRAPAPLEIWSPIRHQQFKSLDDLKLSFLSLQLEAIEIQHDTCNPCWLLLASILLRCGPFPLKRKRWDEMLMKILQMLLLHCRSGCF